MAKPDSGTQATPNLKAPRHWPSWILMGLGYLLSRLPHRLQMRLGAVLGWLAQYLIPSRRRIVDINLRLCYPELSDEQRRHLRQQQFRSVGRGAMEVGLCLWGQQQRLDPLADIEGMQHLEEAATRGRGIILLSAHTTAHVLGVRLGQRYLAELGYRTTAMYKPPHDPVIDRVMRRQYEAHAGQASMTDENVVDLLAALRRGEAVWYAADQKAERRLSVIVDFFGQPARTHIAPSRLAGMTKATVIPFFTLRRRDGRGYRLIFKAPLNHFPSGDEAEDARQINRLIEDVVNEDPAQYFWLHQRFKGTGHNPYKAGR